MPGPAKGFLALGPRVRYSCRVRITDTRVAPWIAPALFVAVRLIWHPTAHNTHTLMYPIVEAAGAYNTLEPFHPLYPLLIGLVRRVWEATGASGPALPALLLLSLLAGCVHLALIHRLVRRVGANSELALGAALIAAASANLWSWSLQSCAYNFSTAALLGTACVLVERETLGLREAAWAGLLVGIAGGFDSAAGLAGLLVVVEVLRRGKKGGSRVAALGVLAAAAAVPVAIGYAGLIWRFSVHGWPFHPSLRGLLDSLPSDIVPLWFSRDLPAQMESYWNSDAPSDWPRLVPVLILAASYRTACAAGWRGAALWRFGAGLWALIGLFYFACDPLNRFLYAGGALLPALLALALTRRSPAWAWCAMAAILLVVRSVLSPPDYAPPLNLGLAEAPFLTARLGSKDTILALSEPDWSLSYALAGRVPIIALSQENEAKRGDGYGERRALYGEPLARELDANLCSGGRVLFAADKLFRDSSMNERRIDAEAVLVFGKLKERFLIDPAWVSPNGQHYFPLRARRCRQGI